MKKPVEMLDTEGNVLSVFPSISEAEKEIGLSSGCISAVISGRRKTSGGYGWRIHHREKKVLSEGKRMATYLEGLKLAINETHHEFFMECGHMIQIGDNRIRAFARQQRMEVEANPRKRVAMTMEIIRVENWLRLHGFL